MVGRRGRKMRYLQWLRYARPLGCVPLPLMRLIVARCEVRYSGRLDALLPMALRLLMVKSDGSVMVQADTGDFKPQNCRP